jgi:hypothetical protein
MEKHITLVTTVSLTSELCSEPFVRPPLPEPDQDQQDLNSIVHVSRVVPFRRRWSSLLSLNQDFFSSTPNLATNAHSVAASPARAVSIMAARGARSRKVVEKVIEKEESKKYADRFNSFSTTPDPSRVVSPVAGWRRKTSFHSGSGAASVWSAESGGSSSGKLSGTGARKIASKVASIIPSEEDRFVAKGKQTAAPRGRGGGVPIKAVEAQHDRARMRSVKAGRLVGSSLGMRPASLSTEYSDTSSTLRPWASTKVWSGGLTPPKSYKGFEHVRYVTSHIL